MFVLKVGKRKGLKKGSNKRSAVIDQDNIFSMKEVKKIQPQSALAPRPVIYCLTRVSLALQPPQLSEKHGESKTRVREGILEAVTTVLCTSLLSCICQLNSVPS